MQAHEAKLLTFLHKSPQFVIPIYQRTYSWTERECRQLWEDILRCGRNEQIGVHFIGSIVYIASGLSQISLQSNYLVIDGQQRLTTVSLLLAALAEIIEEGEPAPDFTQRKIRNYYLLNPEETDERHYKLILTQTDEKTLKAICDQYEIPDEHSIRVVENYENFKKWIQQEKGRLKEICMGLAKLVIVDIALDRDQDNPQLIFESMNSTGKELSQADLIRNYILMGLEQILQSRLYEQYWRPMELGFGQEAYSTHFDSFMRHYLTVKTGEIPKLNAVYDAFKLHATSNGADQQVDAERIEVLVKEIREYSRYYCAMALGTEKDVELGLAFDDLSELKMDVTYPLLLELYADYTLLRWIESYVFRRAVCAIPTNSLNKTFATFTRLLDKSNYLQSAAALFLTLPSYRRFPRDEEFIKEIQIRDLYNFRIRMYWLRRLENEGRKELVSVNEYTIEHIMPQNENLSTVWRQELGSGWQQIQQTWLHTLGNLTLTGYNIEYSDKPFQEKCDMEGGFKVSPIRLNQDVRQCAHWNEDTIKARAARLAKDAINVWKAPDLSADVLALYQPKEIRKEGYSIEDHPYLSYPEIHELFDAFRKSVLGLDPCVNEEFLKLYVAYKAETNFVDVVPQASRLRLSLNMRFIDIHDPKGVCKDVSNLGRWGNGDVEVQLTSLDELPYIIGLVRQSLDLQMGNGDTDE
jgi:uncharacterized protein with ParB-like and HNH nuclease domain/predicted transport protein